MLANITTGKSGSVKLGGIHSNVELRPQMLGISCFFAWSFIMFFGSPAGGLGDSGGSTPLFSCMGNAAGFFLAWALAARKSPFVRSALFDAGSAFVAGLATVALGLGAVPGEGPLVWCRHLLELLTGLGTAWLVASWMRFYCGTGMRGAVACILGSDAIGAAIYALAMFLPRTVQVVLAGVFLIASGVLVRLCGEGNLEGVKEGAGRRFARRTWRGVAAVVLFSIVFWIYWTTYSGEAVAAFGAGPSLLRVSLVALLSVAFLVLAIVGKNRRIEGILQISLMAAVLGIAVTSISSPDFSGVGFALSLFAYVCMDSYLFIILCDAVRSTGFGALEGISAGRAFNACAMPAGMIAAKGLAATGLDGNAMALPLLIIVAVVTAINLGMDTRSLSRSEVAFAEEGDVSDREMAQAADAFLFARKCDKAISVYGLSSREAEIMQMIVRGRSVPYVADRLYIARSTAKTHITSMYKKMGVTSRQEMIDLVESVDVE